MGDRFLQCTKTFSHSTPSEGFFDLLQKLTFLFPHTLSSCAFSVSYVPRIVSQLSEFKNYAPHGLRMAQQVKYLLHKYGDQSLGPQHSYKSWVGVVALL